MSAEQFIATVGEILEHRTGGGPGSGGGGGGGMPEGDRVEAMVRAARARGGLTVRTAAACAQEWLSRG